MNFATNNRNLRLLARNEGKIKSYESCCDVTAWSHDVQKKDRYLKEWMKSDMPFCAIPVCTLASFLRIMTCKSRGKTAPRCHPDCKSKILLETICTSCHAMKECLKNNEEFEKYFEEEEFETCHWPCERCLDALKSIKMFWKILVEKVFKINMYKNTDIQVRESNCIRTDSLRSVAKVWQNDIVHQALFVKRVTPLGKGATTISKARPLKDVTNVSEPVFCEKPCIIIEATKSSKNIKEYADANSKSVIINSKIDNFDQKKSTESNKRHTRPCKKLSRCTSVRIKMNDAACAPLDPVEENEELRMYKTNFEELQQKFYVQTAEIERLQKENTSLRIELQDVYQHFVYKPSFDATDSLNSKYGCEVVPKPFENFMDESVGTNSIKDNDSEMIITMKNCKNESNRHVSVLQVLHKTNEPLLPDSSTKGQCHRNEDPIYLLAKVQTTFGAIVQREMNIASDRRHRSKCNIEATFQRINSSKSVPSCSTVSAYSTNSESNFATRRDIKGSL